MTRLRTLSIVSLLTCLAMMACSGSRREPPAPMAQEEAAKMPDAGEWAARAQSGKDPDAAAILSMMYFDRIPDVEGKRFGQFDEDAPYNPDVERARWLLIALDGKSRLAEIMRRPSLKAAGDDSKAVREAVAWLENAAENGFRNAEFVLGMALYNGIGAGQDKKKAWERIGRAAEHGNPMAQYYTGMAYELGIDRDPDPQKALEWLEKAAKNGNVDAAYILMAKYLDGIGVPKDEKKAGEISALKFSPYKFEFLQSFHAWGKLYDEYAGYGLVTEKRCYDDADTVWVASLDDAPAFDPYGPEKDKSPKEAYARYEEFLRNALDYAVDYDLANIWAERAARDPKNTYAIAVRAEALASQGCHAKTDADSYAEAAALIEKLGFEQPGEADWHIARIYRQAYAERGLPADEENARARLELAAKAGYGPAVRAWKDALDRRQDENDGEEREEDAFAIPMRIQRYFTAFADATAENKRGNQAEAVQQFARIAEDAPKLLSFPRTEGPYFAYYFQKLPWLEMGRIYSDKKSSLYDPEKALRQFVKIYNLLAEKNHPILDFQSKYLLNHKEARGFRIEPFTHATLLDAILQAMADAGRKDMADKAYVRFYEALNGDLRTHYPKASELVSRALAHVPMLPGLRDALTEQIEKQNDVSPESSPVVTDAFPACRAFDKAPCADMLANAAKDALRAITALALAQKGKLDLDAIEETYYATVFIFPIRPEFIFPVRLSDTGIYNALDPKIYHWTILQKYWIVSLIPAAAKDVFDRLKTEISWESYLQRADENIRKHPQLQKGFGYDTARSFQPMPIPES